ncbi:MAG: hypothetical protein EXQ52_07115 [Bryobacterales bacterium]|nr:hypothetical protein [Bryobacterales bacterium]
MKLSAIVPMLTLAFWLAAAPAFPQRVRVGARLGVPVNDAFQTIQNRTPFTLESKRYTFGPSVEVRILKGLTLEADALYRNAEYSTATGSTWEFPLLAKHVHGRGPVRLFLNGGYSFHRLSGFKQFVGTLGIGDRTNRGLVTGGGLELNLNRVKVSPEIRYTRWGTRNIIPAALTEFISNRNQAVFLVGITF